MESRKYDNGKRRNRSTELRQREIEREAFARGGMFAYNEARGYDTTSPDPCGHHCGYDCPRCGDER